MTDQLRAAAEVALGTLKCAAKGDTSDCDDAITLLRDALAEPESMTPTELADRIARGEKWALAEPQQEPVARYSERHGHPFVLPGAPMLNDGQLLYAAPLRREWKGLTDQEIVALIPDSVAWNYEVSLEEAGDFARAVEQKLKEKNG